MLVPDLLSELALDFRQAAKQYHTRREESEAAVITWRWASAPLFSLELLSFERGDHRRGRWLQNEPMGNCDRCQYGLDATNRIVVERHAIWGSDRHKTETFVRYGNDFAESVRFGSMQDKPAEMLFRQSVEGGVVRMCRWYSSHQRGVDLYHYAQDRLRDIDSLWSNQPHQDQDLLSAVFRCDYDMDGKLSLLTADYRKVGRHPGGVFTCYRRPKRRTRG